MAIDSKILREAATHIAEAMELEALAVVAVDRDGSSLVLLSNSKSPAQALALHTLARHMIEGAEQAKGLGGGDPEPDPDEGPTSSN